MEDNKRKLYDALSAEYDLGTFEQFSTDIQDADKRKKLYDATINDYDFGDYDSFSSQLGFSSAQESTVPQQGIVPELLGTPYPAPEVDKSQYTFTAEQLGLEDHAESPENPVESPEGNEYRYTGIGKDYKIEPSMKEQFGKGGLLNQSAEEYMADVQKNIDSRKAGMDFEKLRQEQGINAGRSNVVKKEDRYYTEAGSFDNYSQAAYEADKQDLESDIKSMIDLYKNREGKEWENYERARNLGLAARGFKFDTPEGLKAADRLRGYLRVMPHEAIKALGKDGYEALKFYDNKIREFGEKDAEVRADAERLDEEGTVLQGFEGLGRGMEYLSGETLNVFTGSALDDKEILENWDKFFKDGKLKSPQEMGFRGANEMANRHINYAANFPPVYKDYQGYLAKLLQENDNDVEKVKGIIKERSKDSTLGDWLKTDAAEAINDFKPTAEGVGGFLAEMIPNMAGTLLAIGVGALTKNPAAAKMIGYANLASMGASTAGNSMKEARDAGATNGQVWATGIANGAIEFITEKIPYDKLTGSMFRLGKKGMAAGLRRAVGTPEGQRELSNLLNLAQKELGVDIFNRATAKNYLSNVAAEGLSELSAEALQTMTKAIYASPEEYPTLWEAVQNGWEGMKGGLFMGAVLGGYATVSEAGMHDARRRKQGFVRVAQAEIGGVPVIGEILEEKKDGSLVFMYNGEEKTINKKDIKQEYEFTYDEFRTGELGNIVNNAYEEGYSQEPTGVNAMGAVMEYNQARMDVARVLGLAEDADVDAFLNGRSAEEVAMGDADVENTIVNYQMQKARKEGLQEKFQQTREQQYEESDRIVDSNANKANPEMTYSTQLNGQPVYITGGVVVLNEDGTIDANNSSESLFVKYPDGHVEMTSPDKFTEVFTSDRTADLKAAKRAEIDAKWKAEFDTAEAQSIEQEKRDSGVVFDKADAQENHRIEILNEGEQMSDILIDGKQEQIPTEELNSWKQEAGIQSADAVVDNATDNIAPTGDNVAPVAPVELPEGWDFFRMNGKNYSVASRNDDGSVDIVIDGKRETLPAGTDYSTSMPTDKKGDVQYERMPVERTHEHFVQKVTDDEARAEMIEKRHKKAEAERKKFDKKPDPGLDPDKWTEVNRKWEEGKKAAQAKVDYWNEVAKREAEITRSETREAVENIKPDVVKETAEEFIASHLPKITPESFKRETGLSNEEQSKLVGVISNEGVTIEQAAESIMENYDSELKALGFTGDMQDVRNVIIDVLSQGNPRSYAKNSREAREAENIEQQRAEAEAWAMGTFNMTLEELYVYEETLLPRLTREFEGFDYNEYYNNLAGNYENDTTRESESIGRGGEVLQGEQSVPASGAPVVGERNEGGAVSNDVQGGGQNGVAQEEAINEPVGNSEQLSSSEIPNNQSVAEGNAPGQSGVEHSLSQEEAQVFITEMEANAEVAPEIELTIENWDSLFGEDGLVKTPIGEVKMGENQFTKLMRQGRDGKLGMVKPTLENPDVIIEDESKAKNGETERSSSYVFVKSFKKADGSRYYYFTSVTVSKDGKEVIVSNQEKRRNAIANLLTNGKLVWKHADNVSNASDVANGLYSSQGNSSDLAAEGTDAPQTNVGVNEVYNRHTTAKQPTENVIAELSEPTQSVTASDVSKPEVPEEGGKELLNAETATTSVSEDRNSVSNSQDNAQKSGEIAENGGEIQEPRSVEEDLDNGDKRITSYNSRGEVATVAIERDGKVVSVDSYDEGVLFEHTEYDSKGKASLVTRYDKQGNVISTQRYVNGIESKAFVKETMRTAPLRARAEKWMKETGVPVRLIGIGEEITNSAARRSINAGEKVTGWIDNDEVVLYLPNIRSAKEIDDTFVHEVVAHKGLKALMGDDFNALCDKVWEMMSEEQRAYYLGYPGVNSDTRKAADEYMAHLAEGVDLTDADKTVWQRIVDAVREFLVKHGMKMTDRDIENLIKASYANLKSTEQGVESKEGALFRTTYHGSGAKFDRFDHSFMGTGEGAQAFGWGTYVTEVEGIGRTYATTMRDKAISDKHRENAIINNLARQVLASNNGDKNAALEELRNLLNESWSDKKRVKAEIKIIETGKFLPETKVKANLYSVEIPDDNGSNYLHWEEVVPKKVETAVKERLLERLSEGQGEAYKSDLKQELDDVFRYSDFDGASLYKNISAYLGGDKQASLFLNDMGFVGISYPANATTGGRADGARNYVIFNENDAEIKDRTMFRKKDSERRQEKRRINDAIDTAAGFVTVGGKKQATKNRLKKEAERKELAKEMYSSVLKGDFNDVTLAQIDKFIEDATPANPFGRRISQRLPQRMERALRQGARTNAVDALFSRISESAVPANERFSEAGRREIEERKKELLKGWAIATGNWHTDLKEFTDDTEPIGEGKDSKVYSSKDGRYVIKASKGKPYGKRFRPDIDNIALFNDVFRDTRYEILGYGEIDGEFVRILQQPIVDFAQSTPLTSEERREYMQSLGFEPLNDANTAFADGEIVIADLQKGNVVRDAAGNISVIDADAKLHTKDVGGDYTYPPVEDDLPEQETRFRIANENQDIFVSNAQRAVEGIQQNKATAEQWIAMLKKNGGLKAGEDAWLGLEEWLNEKQGAVTKQEILDYIGENKIQIEEVNYAGGGEQMENYRGLLEKSKGKAFTDRFLRAFNIEYGEFGIFDEQEAIDLYNEANGTDMQLDKDGYWNDGDDMQTIIDWAESVLKDARGDVREIHRTRIQYTTEGLENKREIALVVPTVESYNIGDYTHFGDAGNGRAVAWVRFGETTDSEGNRVLVIDEIQSKRHQEGREKGYGRATSEDVKSALEAVNTAQSELDEYNAEMAKKYGSEYDWNIDATDAEIDKWQELYDKVAQLGQVYEDVAESNRKGIPSAPFEKNWHELAMKRMLRLAAEEGFDKVAWTTGEQQAERYNIRHVVNKLEVSSPDSEGEREVNIVTDRADIYLDVNSEGMIIGQQDTFANNFVGESLSDILGKEVAASILAGKYDDTITNGHDITFGGEGMKGFYDKMLPSFVSKYTKKWGAKVGEVTMPNLGENNVMHSVDVTPEMKESVMEGQTMFRITPEMAAVEDGNISYDEAVHEAKIFEETHKGSAPIVVLDGIDNWESEFIKAGVKKDEIERFRERLKTSSGNPKAVYLDDADLIFIFRPKVARKEFNGYIWHEDMHKAIREDDRFNRDIAERIINTVVPGGYQEVIEYLNKHGYEGLAADEEALCQILQSFYINGAVGRKGLKGKGVIQDYFNPLIDKVYGRRDGRNSNLGDRSVQSATHGTDETEYDGRALATPVEQRAGRESETETQATGGAEETRFRRVEEAIEQQEDNEVRLAKETVTSLGEKLNSPVKIIDDLESVPENRRKWKGWFDPKTGEVVVVIPNHVSTEDAVQTVLHETVAHKGLRAVLGEKFDEFLDGVYKDASQKVKRGINDKFLNALKNGSALTVREATEEYIAELAERDFEGYRDTWNAIRQWFRNFFRNFMNMEITDGELRYLLWKNYNRMKSGPIEIILDRAMEANTGTGKVMARTAETFSAVDSYNKNVKGFKNKVKEGWYDSLRSLKKAQEAIEKTLGKEIDDSSNVYLYANHIPSINKNKMEVFSMRLIRPFADFLKSVYKKNKDIDEKTLERYANAKHGIERNREMSVKAAMTEVQDGKKVFNDTAYREWQEKKKAILANGESWMEQQDKLDALARTYGAKIRDFSGLTAVFDPERKLKYRNIRKAAIDFINSIEQKIDSKKLWEHINGINDYSLRESYESGIISKAQYESISSMYDFYVPLRGHSEMTSDEFYDYITTDHSALSSVVKRAEGRKSEADNIFATMLNMANSAIVYGSKNRLKQRLLNLAMIHSTPLLSVDNAWYEKKGEEYVPAYPDITENMTDEERVAEYARFDEEMKEKEKLGLASRHKPGLNLKYKSVDNWKKQQHAVHVKRNGTEYIVWVNGEPAMANAINGLNLDNDAGGLFEYAQGFNRFRARMMTQYSPEFVLTNGARDIQSSSLVYAVRHGAAAAGRFIKNVAANAKRMGKLYKKYRKGTLDMNNEVERYFKEFLENGGETGYTEMISIDDYKKKMEKMTKGLNMKNATGRAFATMGEGVERANRCVENLCRFSAYLTSRKAGISILKSIEDAKEVSVNFNRKGSGAMGQKYFKALNMFLNPAIQAAAQRIILASKAPKRMYPVLLAEFMLGASNSLLYNMLVSLLYEDDDEENNYYNLTPYRRRSSFILPFMNGVINIPLAHESRVFFGLGEIFTSVLTGHLKLSDVPLEAFKSIAQALPLNPMDGWDPGDDLLGALAANTLGDISRPVAEIMRNKDFAGNRIHNRTDFTEHLPERLRGKRGTAVLYNWISDVLSGDYEKNWMDENFGAIINPSNLEHLAKSILGGLYTTGENIIKTGMWIFGDEEYAEVRNIPFVRSFYTSFDKYEGWEADGRAARDWETAYKYYADEIKRMSDTEKTAKMLEKQGDEGAKEKLKEMEVDGNLLRIDILNDGQKKLKELYEESNEARTAKNMDAVKDVNKRIYELKRSMVERMEMMIDNPAIGYTFLTNKTEGPYGERETYGDVRDVNVINDFQKGLKPIIEEREKSADKDKYQKQYNLWRGLENAEEWISNRKSEMKKKPEKADELMTKIREKRAEAIELINNYRNNE